MIEQTRRQDMRQFTRQLVDGAAGGGQVVRLLEALHVKSQHRRQPSENTAVPQQTKHSGVDSRRP
eukprot:1567196-Prorocentrum_lima.AAC.1